MLLSTIGKYCKKPLIRWSKYQLIKPVQLILKKKPKRWLFFCGIISIPVIVDRINTRSRYERNHIIEHDHSESCYIIENKASESCYTIEKGIFFVYETFSIFMRIVKVIFLFIPIILLFPMTYAGHTCTSIWWDLLLYIIQMSGPVFVKMGQWCSSRRDLFSENACLHFSKLQRQTKPHSWEYTKYFMEKEFGKYWKEIFINFENNKKPIGSGCIAQVYKAYMKQDVLKDEKLLREIRQRPLENIDGEILENVEPIMASNGFPEAGSPTIHIKKMQENDRCQVTMKNKYNSMDRSESDNLVPVAIKVLHPGIENLFKQDIIILRGLAWCASTLCPPLMWLSLISCVNEFEKIMLSQFNLETEAKNLERFAVNFAKVPSITFPEPIWPFVSEKILVETFEEGKGMHIFLNKVEDQQLKSKVAKIGVDALLKMIFKDNFVHADLHPGNIIVQNVDEPLVTWGIRRTVNPLRLCILDCGVSSGLDAEDLIKFESLFREVVFGNGTAIGELFLSKSEHLCTDPDIFKSEMNKLVTEARNEAVSLSKVDVGHLLQNVSFLLMKHKIRLESAFSSIILAVFVLEGLGRSLDKNLDILQRAQPFLKI